jgi:hypothetical protein
MLFKKMIRQTWFQNQLNITKVALRKLKKPKFCVLTPKVGIYLVQYAI